MGKIAGADHPKIWEAKIEDLSHNGVLLYKAHKLQRNMRCNTKDRMCKVCGRHDLSYMNSKPKADWWLHI